MPDTAVIFLGKRRTPLEALLSRANRHGLIVGATGAGQAVTDMVVKSVMRNVAGRRSARRSCAASWDRS